MCCILRRGHLGFLAAELNAVVLSHVAPLYLLPELLFAHVTGAPPGGGALSKNTHAGQKEQKQEEVEAKRKSVWEGLGPGDRLEREGCR